MKPAYIFDDKVGNAHYGPGHPMKPHRIAITNSLVHSYNLDKHLDIIKPTSSHETIESKLHTYHTKDYIQSLSYTSKTDDCPCFPGISDYFIRYTRATFTAAQILNCTDKQIAINWSGGLHHAKKSEASGFCYVNDIVIGILELLKVYKRVLYIDIDIHHGDGVEEAFYNTDRVMTLSLHKFGDNYFPGTGEIFLTGIGEGKGYTVNVPLNNGMDDACYKYVFEPIVETAMQRFDPDVVVMQCGADSLAGDRLGCFNLSIYGHAECLRFVKRLVEIRGKKLMVLGGGGYNLKNVSRCWVYETGVLCGQVIDNDIPESDVYYDCFAGDYVIHPTLPRKYDNLNSRKYLDVVKGYVCTNLNKL